jgi:tRNA G18 (ribose-2'-O)-methylase SpoU
VRSSENVGSIFRTCDAAGVSKIILCGYTPAPVDRFGRENKGLTKASLGAEKLVAWEKFENLKSAGEKLRKENFKIVGIEQDKNSIDYCELKNSKSLVASSMLALVFGNEVEGLSKEDLKLCDLVAEIPMHGKKESLNVSVSAGIILFEIRS